MPAVLRARRSVQRRLSTRPPLRRIAWAVDRLRSGSPLTAAGIAAQFEISQRTVEPYHVYNLRGDWYLAAFDPRHGAVRDFALHRIVKPTTLDETFAHSPEFDFAAYLGYAFGIENGGRPVEVSIRFGPRQARWIREKRWHTTARIQDGLDGGCILRMRVTGLAEVQRWVLQFGPEAEVLSPPSLRRDVAAALRETLRSYRPRRSTRRV